MLAEVTIRLQQVAQPSLAPTWWAPSALRCLLMWLLPVHPETGVLRKSFNVIGSCKGINAFATFLLREQRHFLKPLLTLSFLETLLTYPVTSPSVSSDGWGAGALPACTTASCPTRAWCGVLCKLLSALLWQDGVCCQLGACLCHVASWRGFGAEQQCGKQGSTWRNTA